MGHKFKIGDYVRRIEQRIIFDKETFKVIDIVEGMRPYYGNWASSGPGVLALANQCAILYHDSYVVEICNDTKRLHYIQIGQETGWECARQDNHLCCPRCKNELTQVESESILGTKYSGQKCSACGYCA